MLIDNGHFQYNSLMLGLALWSFVFLRQGRDGLACVAFVGSLGFKQVALYWAPAVGVWLVGKCWNLGGQQGFVRLWSRSVHPTPGLTSVIVVFGCLSSWRWSR